MLDFVDPRSSPSGPWAGPSRPTADSLEALEPLHRSCREGKVYDVEGWIQSGKPLQLSTESRPKGHRPTTALEIALKTGQQGIVLLLLSNGYRLALELCSPLNLALEVRRWDLVDLLLAWGANPAEVSLYRLFSTYNLQLFERFRALGVDLTEGHHLASALAYHSSNKPLFGFAKRHRETDPRVQTELDIALGYHVREGHEKGILLSLWAGANPHARVRDLEYGTDDGKEEELETAVESATDKGNVGALRKFKPDPARLDFDRLYERAADRSVVEFLAAIQLPRDLTRILQNQAFRAGYYMDRQGDWQGAFVAVLNCGVRWEAAEPRALSGIRLDLLKADNSTLKNILAALMRPEVCSPEVLNELTRTPTMQRRMLDMGLIKPRVRPPSKAAIERREIATFRRRYDRERIHKQVWSQPVSQVAKSYGVSGSYLGRVCRTLRIPVPARGYWAKLKAGRPVHAKPLGRLPAGTT